jgi:hypothetical protein
LSEPGLQNDDPDCGQVCDSECSIVDPRPPGQLTDQYQYESDNDKNDEREVNEE